MLSSSGTLLAHSPRIRSRGGTRGMAMNPFEARGIPLERQIRQWSQVAAALALRVTDLIAQDHRRVRELFLELERMDASDGERRALLDRIVDELDVHARRRRTCSVRPCARPA